MRKFFNRCAAAIRRSWEPLSEDMPVIEWVKSVNNMNAVLFAARHSFSLASRLDANTIIMKATDGRVFSRRFSGDNSKWSGQIEGKWRHFKSPYLDFVTETALKRGMTTQPSASDLRTTLYKQRRLIYHAPSDAEFVRLNKQYPIPPTGYKDYHAPEDFAITHPDFVAYLKRNHYVPFRNLGDAGKSAALKPPALE